MDRKMVYSFWLLWIKQYTFLYKSFMSIYYNIFEATYFFITFDLNVYKHLNFLETIH